MAAFLEGCLPGLVFIFLLASDPYGQGVATSLCVLSSLLGLAIFLGLRSGGRLGAGERMVLFSAVLTAVELILASTLLPASGTSLVDKLKQSLANTAWTALLAGVGTLFHARFVARVKFVVPDRRSISYILFGTCLGWGSFFVLVREDVLVAATSEVAVPVAVAAFNGIVFRMRMERRQLWGGALICLSLILLVVIKLA